MRHDIDRKRENALNTARIEAVGNKGDVLFQEVWKYVLP